MRNPSVSQDSIKKETDLVDDVDLMLVSRFWNQTSSLGNNLSIEELKDYSVTVRYR